MTPAGLPEVPGVLHAAATLGTVQPVWMKVLSQPALAQLIVTYLKNWKVHVWSVSSWLYGVNSAAISLGMSRKLRLDGDEIEARIDELEARKTTLEAQIADQVIADEDIRDIVMYSRDAAVGLDNPTFEQKRRWIEILQVQVELTSQTTAIARCILPVKPFPLILTRQDIREEEPALVPGPDWSV